MAVDRAAGGVRGHRGKEGGIKDAEAHFLAFHVAGGLVNPQGGQPRVAVGFRPPADQHPHQEEQKHGGPHRPAVLLVPDHAAQVIGQPGGNQEDGEHLEEVRQRRRVFKGMRGVGVGEAAAVGAQHLDGHLGGHGPLGDRLGLDLDVFHHRVALGVLDRVAGSVLLGHLSGKRLHHLGGVVGLKVLDHPLGDQKHRKHQADGQQQVEAGADQIGPEIPQGRGLVPGDAPHQGGGDGDAHRGRKEVVRGQGHHLRQIGHGAFAAVVLPVGVGGETGRGIKGQVAGHPAEALGIERQDALQPQDEIGQAAG